MKQRKFSIAILVVSILLPTQYILAFFIYKLPGVKVLQWVGWGIWIISVIFGIAPIFILRTKGGVAKGRSFVETTCLVDSSLYAIVRHPQYVAGMLFNLALMLMAQHWVIILVGAISMILIYIDIQAADKEGIEKFGEIYRQYMEKVPQINFPLGIIRLIRQQVNLE